MFREILGILSDVIGVVFLWWHPETLLWYWKLLISVGFVFIAVGFHFLTKDRPVAKVKDYLYARRRYPYVVRDRLCKDGS